MKVITIDDEQSGLNVIRSHSSKISFLTLEGEFLDAMEALKFLHTHKVDLIFLDIEMPDISGIEFYNSLEKKPLLIFTTAYSQYAPTAFEINAVDYLLKPFSFERFLGSCNRAYEIFKSANRVLLDSIFVREGSELVKINLKNINYLEASGNYVVFNLESKKVIARLTLVEALDLLPSQDFVRVHRSFVVCLNKIEKANRFYVTVVQTRIPIGRVYRRAIEQLLKTT